MSRKRPWWNYVKSIVREYPALKKERDTPLDTKITASYDSVGRGTAISDPTANAVVHDLPREKMRKLEAVEQAIVDTKKKHDNWKIRLEIVDLVYWRKTCTIYGAAQKVYVNVNTAAAYQADFIKEVARILELP